jgi:asparagine synthase (glutamine-hydrolysing)
MCGIAGFVGNGEFTDLMRMTRSMIHRGPDDEGFWFDAGQGVWMGHRRLSVLDIGCGKQPMADPKEGLVVVFNGEIYNHLELRSLLQKQGHRFITDHSDTEVLIHGYRQWGEKLPCLLNGMWAFAIYDRTRKTLFLSRDRFGKKPLYYTFAKQGFIFASELTALMCHPSVERSLSDKGLRKFFAYGYIPSPNSIVKNVYKLPGGHNLVVDVDDMNHRMEKYWDFRLEPFDEIPKSAERIWAEMLLERLENAVRRRLVADVPVGIFLSGGIDSSTVALLAMKHAIGDPVKTFSIGFEDTSFDETRFCRLAARHIGSEHHVEILSLERARTVMESILARIDEPMGDASLIPTYLLCQTTRKAVTVALGGDGADELFAGYDPFLALHIAKLYESLVPKAVHRGISMAAARLWVSHRNMSFDFKLKRFLRGLNYPERFRNPVWLGPMAPPQIEQLFNEDIDLEDLYSEAIELWDSCGNSGMVDKTLQFYTKLYLQDDILVKVDRSSMLNSLEVRSPFLDIDLVNFVRKIPSVYKFRKGKTKYILKKAVSNLLPKEIVNRPKKGFGMPIGKWFQENRLPIDLKSLNGRLFRPFVKRLETEHRNNVADHRSGLWNILNLSSWNGSRSCLDAPVDDQL